MLMKICIAGAVALGCSLAVPGASFAASDKDKLATASASTDKPRLRPPSHIRNPRRATRTTSTTVAISHNRTVQRG